MVNKTRIEKAEKAIETQRSGARLLAWKFGGKYCITTATLKDGYQSMLYPLAGNPADFTLTKAEVDAEAVRLGAVVELIEVVQEEGRGWPAR